MDLNFVNKSNVGIIGSLLLVIVLSQSQALDFFFNNALGRTLLIVFILVISYLNKILGVVSVLLIIICFNQSDLANLEGFTYNKEAFTSPKHTSSIISNPAPVPKSPSNPKPKHKSKEGVDLITTENNIKRGKQSSQIIVNPHMTESLNVDAFDGDFTANLTSIKDE